MNFKYLLDPLFLCCLALYFINRWVLKGWLPHSFFTDHLNDLLCIPFCVPVMLCLLRKLRLRTDDAPPQVYELVIPLVLWSIVFEMWLRTIPFFKGLATADHLDVFWYAAGALMAGIWWRKYYGPERSTAESRSL